MFLRLTAINCEQLIKRYDGHVYDLGPYAYTHIALAHKEEGSTANSRQLSIKLISTLYPTKQSYKRYAVWVSVSSV